MPQIETLFFPKAEDFDDFFREGREAFNPIYVLKMATMSTFYSRVPSQPWILNSGTSARGFRIGRQWYDPTKPWQRLNSDRCETNFCDSKPEIILRSGTQSYNYHLLRKEQETEWFCVADLLTRLMPAEEIMAFEQANATITKHVYEEFNRANWIGSAGYHWMGIASANATYCGESESVGWMFPALGDPEGGYDTRYCYVKVDPTVANAFDNIALLSLDMLDDILIRLSNEDDAYRLDIQEELGGRLLDLIVPDARVARDIFFQAKTDRGWDQSTAGYTDRMTMARLGIERIVESYAMSYDIDALRFNVDSAYNTALVGGNGYAYDENDTDTWPRLIRVPRYVKSQVEIGCEWIPNVDYEQSDFGITVPFVEKGMVQHYFPSGNTGYGSVRMEDQDWAGNFNYRRPDWPTNPKRKMGFFEAEFVLSAETKDPTVMNPVLHRLNRSKNLRGACCPLNDYLPSAEPDCWACGAGGTLEDQAG